MAIVPSNTQFRGDTTGVPVVDKGSALTNSRAEYYTMADIAESVPISIPNNVTGSGTANKVSKFTSANVIGDGLLNDDGVSIWYNGPSLNDTRLAYGKAALSQGGGTYNTAIGFESQLSNVSGLYNTSLGFRTLANLTTGSNNVALGEFALQDIVGAFHNIGIGYTAGWKIQTGNSNVAIGRACLQNNVTGDDNIGIGQGALQLTTSGYNVGVGGQSLKTNTTGQGNSALGYLTNSGNFSHSVILGREATASADNQFVVGSATYNAGSVVTQANTSSKYWEVVINGSVEKVLLA